MAYRPQYFQLYELVCPEVYNKFGDRAWGFLDEKLLVTLDWIRRTLDRKITVNNWYNGGRFDERGLRCIQCKMVHDKCMQGQVYVSGHILGRAADFDVDGLEAGEVRVWLAANKDKLPYNIRLENHVSWVHLDTEDTGKKIHIFTP